MSPTPKGFYGGASRMAAKSYSSAILPCWRRCPAGRPTANRSHSMTAHAGKPVRIYLVSADGGGPQLLLPEDPEPQRDPNWSPDGDKIQFNGVQAENNSAIRMVDLITRQVSTLPGSRGMYSARWSPDGRYIVAKPADRLP